MREWIEEISDYMREKETTPLPLAELSEEIYQAALEIDMLVETLNHHMQPALTSIVGKIE